MTYQYQQKKKEKKKRKVWIVAATWQHPNDHIFILEKSFIFYFIISIHFDFIYLGKKRNI